MQTATTNELTDVSFQISRLFKENLCYTSPITHLSILQLQALIFIKQHPNVQMRDIAAHFRIELPSATSLLNKLHQMKMVTRKTDTDDRRVVRIMLTNEGQTLLNDAMIERGKKMEKVLSFLSEHDKMALLRILKTLATKMETKQ
jgi:DNA-binding MarR family transcriptional regulator